ncbi:GNAT family N-acetyltransferase [Actinacidiphila yeochonensis]|uniref:GNAT family N-acetyltransferase n=1 Tax=Actinacidiphila yeochonensis TaxID=89050 RepID=UPI00055B3151|nr:GNAT family N-acetyltransferase [Actinacidiphila yeochonensis]
MTRAPSTAPARVRQLRDGDWGGVAALEAAVYGPLGLSEGRAALESRGRSSPGTCFVLDRDRDLDRYPDAGAAPGSPYAAPGSPPTPAGYLLALPYPEGASPDLRRPERTVHRCGNLHLHDMAVAPDLRGRGLGGRLLRHLTAVARAGGFERISLVAVGGSESFWSARGFTARPGPPPRGGYGPAPVYMSMAVRAEVPTALPTPSGRAPRDPAPR